MKNYTVCILDKDIHYTKAFIKAVAVGHTGFSVIARHDCGADCPEETDVCLRFEPEDKNGGTCEKSFRPACGKYGGVTAILSEAGKFAFDRDMAAGKGALKYGDGVSPLNAGSLLCAYAYKGGLGTSCAAIGIGREFARYRGEKAMYLSLEDIEDEGLFPAGLSAMRTEEVLYRYLRLIKLSGGNDEADRLFVSAVARDEYGLYRFAPDTGAGSLAGVTAGELYILLANVSRALGLSRIVLDFGTRLNFLFEFASFIKPEEALFVEMRQEGGGSGSIKRQGLLNEERRLSAAFPYCAEDIRKTDGYTDVGIANAFGLAVKELCDRIEGFSV